MEEAPGRTYESKTCELTIEKYINTGKPPRGSRNRYQDYSMACNATQRAAVQVNAVQRRTIRRNTMQVNQQQTACTTEALRLGYSACLLQEAMPCIEKNCASD